MKEKGAVLAFISSVLVLVLLFSSSTTKTYAATAALISSPFLYTFNSDGVVSEALSNDVSGSPYFWVKSGGQMPITLGVGESLQGSLPVGSYWQGVYATRSPGATDGGVHPQNVFQAFTRTPFTDVTAQLYVDRVRDNLSNTSNRHSYNGESLLLRYLDANNYYFAGVRADGTVAIKKKTNGVYQTLATKQVLPGNYDATKSPDLIPLGTWVGLRFSAVDSSSGVPTLSLYTDVGHTGTWTLALSVVDDPSKYSAAISSAGLVGLQSDFADVQFDDWRLSTPAPPPPPPPAPVSYDATVLADTPVMYLDMSAPASLAAIDKTGNGHTGTYKGGTVLSTTLPNGDGATVFNGTSQYLTVPSSPALSIPTTHQLTWEGWVRPDTLQFLNTSSDGYVDWMGKCENYSPNCEWEARMYSLVTTQGRANRLSAYVFNPSAGLGSAADWQPATSLLQTGQWLYVVAEYQTLSTPSQCASAYPGTINIWVNGVQQSFADHAPTGCMSQFSVAPKVTNSPLDIGTMALDTWFKGAIGKVAVYNHLLTQAQISAHYAAMTGVQPTGSCGVTCTIPVPTP